MNVCKTCKTVKTKKNTKLDDIVISTSHKPLTLKNNGSRKIPSR